MENNNTVEVQSQGSILSAFMGVEQGSDTGENEATEQAETTSEESQEEATVAESTEEVVADQNAAPAAEVPVVAEQSETQVTEKVEATDQDWKKVLKDQKLDEVIAELGDKKAILKALGISDFVIDLNDHFQKNGDVKKYMEVASRNYGEMDDDSVILEAIRSAHPNAPDNVVKRLLAKELDAYKSDPEVDDDETKELNAYLKKEKADKYREQLIAEQQKFLIPEQRPVSETVDTKSQEQLDKEAAQEQEVLALVNKINEDPETKKLLSDKKLLIGGEAKYQFAVDNPEELRQMATGEKNFFGLFLREDGSFDMGKWYATAAFTKNQADYEKALINYGKTLALKEHVDSDENPPTLVATPAPKRKPSILEAFRGS